MLLVTKVIITVVYNRSQDNIMISMSQLSLLS